MSTIVYISSFQGKTKDKQRDFNKITVACLKEGEAARVFDLFAADGSKFPEQDNLKFGDIVELKYRDSDYPGGRPQLVGMVKTADSPF